MPDRVCGNPDYLLWLFHIGGCQTEQSIVMKQNLKKFEKDVEMQRQMHPEMDEELRKSIQMTEKFGTIDEDQNHVDIVGVEDEEKDNFDCESILTTYSTIYNHPKLIKEPSIKVCIIEEWSSFWEYVNFIISTYLAQLYCWRKIKIWLKNGRLSSSLGS